MCLQTEQIGRWEETDVKNLFQWGVWLQESVDSIDAEDREKVLKAVSGFM